MTPPIRSQSFDPRLLDRGEKPRDIDDLPLLSARAGKKERKKERKKREKSKAAKARRRRRRGRRRRCALEERIYVASLFHTAVNIVLAILFTIYTFTTRERERASVVAQMHRHYPKLFRPQVPNVSPRCGLIDIALLARRPR